jgi:hypothetical protein
VTASASSGRLLRHLPSARGQCRHVLRRSIWLRRCLRRRTPADACLLLCLRLCHTLLKLLLLHKPQVALLHLSAVLIGYAQVPKLGLHLRRQIGYRLCIETLLHAELGRLKLLRREALLLLLLLLLELVRDRWVLDRLTIERLPLRRLRLRL